MSKQHGLLKTPEHAISRLIWNFSGDRLFSSCGEPLLLDSDPSPSKYITTSTWEGDVSLVISHCRQMKCIQQTKKRRTWQFCRRTWWSCPPGPSWLRTRRQVDLERRTTRSSPPCWAAEDDQTGCRSHTAREGSGSSQSPADTSCQLPPPSTRTRTRLIDWTSMSPSWRHASYASRRRRTCNNQPSSLLPEIISHNK